MKVTEKIQDTFQELALVVGFFILGYGLYQIYQPLAWVVCGLLLILFGAWDVVLFFNLRKKG